MQLHGSSLLIGDKNRSLKYGSVRKWPYQETQRPSNRNRGRNRGQSRLFWRKCTLTPVLVLIGEVISAQEDIERLQKAGVVVNMVASGLASPANSVAGVAASAMAPGMSYLIGQYFKENSVKNVIDNGDSGGEGSASHILAHFALAAAVASAGDGNALIAGIAAGGAEVAAPALAKSMYGKDARDLNAEEKSTIEAIVGIGGATLGSFQKDLSAAIAGSNAAQNASSNNWGEVGHYSTMATVLYLAGFSEKDAKAIALAAWSPDTDSRNAMSPNNILNGLDKSGAQQSIHDLDGEGNAAAVIVKQQQLGQAVEAILTSLKQNENDPVAKAKILSDPETQRVLHSFGDSYAHVDYEGAHYAPVVGHAADSVNGWDPDNPNTHKVAYTEYADAIYNIASKVSNKPLVTSDDVYRMANSVETYSSDNAQKSVLDEAISHVNGTGNKELVDSPVGDCGVHACGAIAPGGAANQAIYDIYNIKPTSTHK